MVSTLIAHVDAQKVTRASLAALPAPEALGPRHRPIPHEELVDAIHAEADSRCLRIAKEEFALGHGGATLFAVFDFSREMSAGETGFALGLRSSQDQSLALRGAAGARVFVCDNLALAGSVFAFNRKHTNRLDLAQTIRTGFDRYEQDASHLQSHIERLRADEIGDGRAKDVIYEALAQRVIPMRLFHDIHAAYFQPSEVRPDCAPRTLWGLHNAFTRALKRLSPQSAWSANVGLGRLFGLTQN